MDTLTKLILNNQIVDMRQCVRRSRIHSIHKLTREIRKLREKKGTDEQKSKNLKKADRFVKEIAIMKETKDDEISKFALVNEKSMIDITNDVSETLENKALARLVHHEAVAGKVETFREKFANWREAIIPLLEVLGEKYRNKKSSKKMPVQKHQISNSKGANKMKPNKNSSEVVHTTSGTWVVQESESVAVSSQLELETHSEIGRRVNQRTPLETDAIQHTEPSKENTKVWRKQSTTNSISESENDRPVKKRSTTRDCSGAVNPFLRRNTVNSGRTEESEYSPTVQKSISKSGSGVINAYFRSKNNISSGELGEDENRPTMIKSNTNNRPGAVNSFFLAKSNSSSAEPNEEENHPAVDRSTTENCPGAVDSFFLTKDNAEYFSISAKENTNSSAESKSRSEPDFEQEHYEKPRFRESKRTNSSWFGTGAGHSKRQDRDVLRSRNSLPGCSNKFEMPKPISNEALHPSWAAKRKVTQIVQFQGKKIKFDEN